MTSTDITEKITRSAGSWTPSPDMVGYLLGSRGMTLKSLAKEINDGVFIVYNDETKCFDIQARSPEGVCKAIEALQAKQTEGQQIPKPLKSLPVRLEKTHKSHKISKAPNATSTSSTPNAPSTSSTPNAPSLVRILQAPMMWTPKEAFDRSGTPIENVFCLTGAMLQIPENYLVSMAEITVKLVSNQTPSSDSLTASQATLPHPCGAGGWPTASQASQSSASSVLEPISPIGKAHPALSAPKSPVLTTPAPMMSERKVKTGEVTTEAVVATANVIESSSTITDGISSNSSDSEPDVA